MLGSRFCHAGDIASARVTTRSSRRTEMPHVRSLSSAALISRTHSNRFTSTGTAKVATTELSETPNRAPRTEANRKDALWIGFPGLPPPQARPSTAVRHNSRSILRFTMTPCWHLRAAPKWSSPSTISSNVLSTALAPVSIIACMTRLRKRSVNSSCRSCSCTSPLGGVNRFTARRRPVPSARGTTVSASMRHVDYTSRCKVPRRGPGTPPRHLASRNCRAATTGAPQAAPSVRPPRPLPEGQSDSARVRARRPARAKRTQRPRRTPAIGRGASAAVCRTQGVPGPSIRTTCR